MGHPDPEHHHEPPAEDRGLCVPTPHPVPDCLLYSPGWEAEEREEMGSESEEWEGAFLLWLCELGGWQGRAVSGAVGHTEMCPSSLRLQPEGLRGWRVKTSMPPSQTVPGAAQCWGKPQQSP